MNKMADGGSLQERFRLLADRWRRETGGLSSMRQASEHPDYQAIIAMGEVALPLILREMKEHHGHWFIALRAVTGENPTKPEDAGYIARLRESWLEWGRAKGLID